MCDECGWESAVTMANDALSVADDIIDGEGYSDAAVDFASSVSETIRDISDTIAERSHVSDRQYEALENMSAAIDKWVRN